MTTDKWFFKVAPTRDGRFMAWCARTPNLGQSPLDVAFEEDVYFEFGASESEALGKLKREVLH